MEDLAFHSKIINYVYYSHPESSTFNFGLSNTLGDYKPCEEVAIFNDSENKHKGITLFDSLVKEIVEEEILDKRLIEKYNFSSRRKFVSFFFSGLFSFTLFGLVITPTFFSRSNYLFQKLSCVAFISYGVSLCHNYYQNKKNEFLMDLYLISPLNVKKYLIVKDYRYLMEYNIDKNDFKLPY